MLNYFKPLMKIRHYRDMQKGIRTGIKRKFEGWDMAGCYDSTCEVCYEKSMLLKSGMNRYDGKDYQNIRMYYDKANGLPICENCIDDYIKVARAQDARDRENVANVI